ncbi:MAG: radical SAM protein [Bacteroidetes bacterium]|nr:radical SAM protein [Bacteroidota bacterium]
MIITTNTTEHCAQITVKSALHYHESEMPCHWDVNVYRGCGHGCKYCFAQYSHDYMQAGDFFGNIMVKTNVAQVLDKELSKRSWKKLRINLSGVTDPYQPAEADFMLMPGVLKVLIRHRNPVVLTTKSSLIFRDIELLRELASVTSVSIGSSITMMDENLRQLIEPGASPALERFRLLEACKQAGCRVNILLTPVLPLITDNMENLDEIYMRAAEIRVNGVSPWPLNLRGSTKERFMGFLSLHFPDLLPGYRQIFQGWRISKAYEEELRRKVLFLRDKYRIPEITLPQLEQANHYIQLDLF